MLCVKTEDCERDESGPALPTGPGPDLQRRPPPPNKGEKKAAVFGAGAEKRRGLSEGGGTLEVPL